MRVNSNMLMGLVLCMVLFGGVAFLTRINKGQHVWTPNDIYSSIGGSSYSIANVSTSTASNLGVTLSLRSSRPLLSSARRTTSSVIPYAPAQYSSIVHTQYPIGGTPSNSVASPLYTTSSATMKSFGGGNSAGVSMSGGTVRSDNSVSSVASANIAYASLPATSVPYTYMYTPDENQAVAASVYSGAPAMVNDRYPFSSYRSQITYDSKYHSASLYGGSFATTRGITNRQKSGITNSWLDWLYQAGWNYGTGVGSDETGWTYTFTEQQLREAYDYYIDNVWYWDPMWGGTENKPSFEEWLAWLKNGGDAGYEYKGNRFALAPVGGVLPLLVMAVLYVVISFLFQKRHVKNAESC